eukprot:scaffold63983_cov60-Phaeocystis_antarctica.AAC.3
MCVHSAGRTSMNSVVPLSDSPPPWLAAAAAAGGSAWAGADRTSGTVAENAASCPLALSHTLLRVSCCTAVGWLVGSGCGGAGVGG